MKKWVLFFVFISTALFSQNSKVVDSLLLIVKKQPQDTSTINALRYLSWEYEGSDNVIYFNYCNQALLLAQKLNNESFIGTCFMDLGIAHDYIGNGDSALFYYSKSEQIFKKLKNESELTAVYVNTGSAYRSLGNFSKALDYNFQALRIAEKLDKKDRIADCKNAIGNIYRQKNNLDLALKYSKEALVIYLEVNDLEGISRVSGNIGIIYSELKDSKSALEYYFKSLEIRLKLNSLSSISNCYSNIACEYYEMSKFSEALMYHNKALVLNEQLNNKKGVAIDLTNIAAVNTKQKKYTEALERLKLAEQYAEETKFRDLLKEIYQTTAQNYELIGDFKNAYQYHQKFTAIKDAIYNDNENEIIAEMQTKYETDKKDSEIELLNTAKKLQDADLKRKSIIIWAFLVGLVLVIVLAFYIYRGYKIKQKANEVITQQKKEVEQQKTIIEEKQKEIVDSITYAKRIQYALLASDSFLETHLPEYFVLFKPKDIVSGDFYWAATQGDSFYLAACDSTGHGVPGAFMSLLNTGFLSEAIKEKKIAAPNEIFNYVRKRLIESISNEHQQDGMDATLIKINNNKLEYASANNKAVVIRNNELIELSCDKMPIGKSPKENQSFSSFSFDLLKGDCIYLFTDGFADQFGGENGKKFKYKQLHSTLIANSSEPMERQKAFLSNVFEVWKGNLEQVDDVLLIGIRI
jgi:serine phosphatase RsbU (regulator of sigma subunit)